MEKKIKKISKLNIKVHDRKKLETKYKEERLYFISNREEFVPGGFFQSNYYKKNPDLGEAEWNNKYPNGLDDWIDGGRGDKLSSYGQQQLIDKINELTLAINKTNLGQI